MVKVNNDYISDGCLLCGFTEDVFSDGYVWGFANAVANAVIVIS